MTVATATNEVVYTGDGATTEFPFTFPVVHDEDLVVERRDATTDVVDLTYVLGTDYEVFSDYPVAGGSITLIAASPSAAYELVIRREVTYTQELDLVNQTGFFPEEIEGQLDKIVMQIQQLEARITALEP